jgi:hypothetical protein
MKGKNVKEIKGEEKELQSFISNLPADPHRSKSQQNYYHTYPIGCPYFFPHHAALPLTRR